MAIVVTELPYQVNKAALVEKIAELVKGKKIEGIADLRDESDRDGMRLVIECKRDANPRKVLNNLFKHTPLQLAFNVNILALVDGQPQTLPLKADPPAPHRLAPRGHPPAHRVRPAEGARPGPHPRRPQDRARQPRRGHPTIRESADVETARANLMARFALSEIQANAILEMQLRRLAALERKKIEDEYIAIIQLIAELEDILANPRRVLDIIKDENDELEAQVRRAARTRIADDASRELSDEDLIADEDVVITVSGRGYIKRQPLVTYRRQARGGKGIIGARTVEEDAVGHLLVANTHDWALFFTDRGRVFSSKVHAVPDASRQAKGIPIINLEGVQVEAGERVLAVITLPNFEKGDNLVMATQQGIIKKTPVEQFERVRSTGIRAITVAEDDALAWVGGLVRPRRHRARHRAGQDRPLPRARGAGHGPRRGRRHRHPAGPQGRPGRRHGRRRAGRRHPGADRDRLRQARRAGRLPDQASRRPGRPAHRARGHQDGQRRRRRAGHRGRTRSCCSSAPAARSCAPTSRASTATAAAPAASS